MEYEAEAFLVRTGQRETQPQTREEYLGVDAELLEAFEEESKREDAGRSTAPLV